MKDNYQHFFTIYYPKVKSFAFRILFSEEDAEDVAQDIFIKLLDLPEIWQGDEINDKLIFNVV